METPISAFRGPNQWYAALAKWSIGESTTRCLSVQVEETCNRWSSAASYVESARLRNILKASTEEHANGPVRERPGVGLRWRAMGAPKALRRHRSGRPGGSYHRESIWNRWRGRARHPATIQRRDRKSLRGGPLLPLA